MEVEDEPEGLARDAKIGDKLGDVSARDALHALHLDHDGVVHQHVEAAPDPQGTPAEFDLEWTLKPNATTCFLEDHRHGTLVDALKQAWPQFAVDIEGRVQHPAARGLDAEGYPIVGGTDMSKIHVPALHSGAFCLLGASHDVPRLAFAAIAAFRARAFAAFAPPRKEAAMSRNPIRLVAH